MWKLFAVFVFAFVTIACEHTSTLFKIDKQKTGVKYHNSRGTIFTTSYPFLKILISGVDSTKRWTPDTSDIELAERILKTKIKTANKEKVSQSGSCPVIHRHLNAYFRQYVGLISPEGHHLIHINMTWNKFPLKDRFMGESDSRLDFSSDYSSSLNGCSYYWQVMIDLNEKTIVNFDVNGFD